VDVQNNRFILSLEPAEHLDILTRERPDVVDFGYLRSVIAHCDNHHATCKKTGQEDSLAIPIILIDCDTFTLHVASPDMKYAALS
jgi:hypothetical protein